MDDKSKDSTKSARPELGAKVGNLVRVDIGQLQMGMYVAELDRPWLETPFLMQGFKLRNKAQLRTLERFCEYVYIRSQLAAPKKQPQTVVKTQAPKLTRKANKGTMLKHTGRVKTEQKRRIARSRPAHGITLPVLEEYPVAELAYRKGKSEIKKILHSAQFGQILDTEAAENVVYSCVESMLRNPNAMIWMSKIKHENEYVAEHCLNVCILAIAFGRHLNFDETELQVLGLCGLLHDVGTVRTPKVILNKSGALTDEEFLVMTQHTIEGHKLLKADGGASPLSIDVALNHHERPDGKGYPRGLKAGEISEYARIIAIIDAYDAMTSERCYSEAVSPVDAQKEIYQSRGKQFDEEYALAFMQAIGPYPPGTVLELRNGMVGIVLTGHLKSRHLPTVILSRDADKQIIDDKIIDLSLTDGGKLGKEFLVKRTLPDGSFGVSVKNYKLG
ncbi:MAG: HD-GYP domain-containing protein [Candidatus Reddybacter sp.]